jgi:hypothetical protein
MSHSSICQVSSSSSPIISRGHFVLLWPELPVCVIYLSKWHCYCSREQFTACITKHFTQYYIQTYTHMHTLETAYIKWALILPDSLAPPWSWWCMTIWRLLYLWWSSTTMVLMVPDHLKSAVLMMVKHHRGPDGVWPSEVCCTYDGLKTFKHGLKMYLSTVLVHWPVTSKCISKVLISIQRAQWQH